MTKLPTITKKQEAIILHIYRFRFLNRAQIQRLLNHQYISKINTWLRDLTQKEYLSRSYKTSFPDNLLPAVYHLNKNSIGFIKTINNDNTKSLKKFYFENERSNTFINCSILLADIYLEFQKKRDDKVISIMQVRSDYPLHPLRTLLCDLNPHAYIAQKKSGKTRRYFLEILADLPVARLKQRIKKYLSFYQSNEWEGRTKEFFPTVLIVCPDDHTLSYIKRYTKTKIASLDEPDLAVNLTTAEKVKQLGITGDIWKSI